MRACMRARVCVVVEGGGEVRVTIFVPRCGCGMTSKINIYKITLYLELGKAEQKNEI